MTDPSDGPAPDGPVPDGPVPDGSEPLTPEPAPGEAISPAPAPAPATGSEVPGSEPVPPVTGWIAPEGGSGGGRRRGCIIAVVIIGAFLVFGYIGLVFLGNQVQSILGGTIQFGTSGSGCSVNGTATSFPASTAIHSVAYLERKTTTGETITIAVSYPDGTTDSTDQAMAAAADCLTQDIAPGLDPGHYGLEYRAGTEVLAKGGFDITP